MSSFETKDHVRYWGDSGI